MALTAVKTWVDGEVLTSSDLNAEFSNLLTNGESLAWPATTTKDLDGNALILDSDADTSVSAAVDDIIQFLIQGVNLLTLNGSVSTAVNGFTMTMSAAAVNPTLAVTGSDTNLDLNLLTKGTGILFLNGANAVFDNQQYFAHQFFGT